MGESSNVRRLAGPATLALVLTLVLAISGSASSLRHTSGAMTAGPTTAATGPSPAEPPASVTAIAPVTTMLPTAAVRLAATGPTGSAPVQAPIADVLLRAYRSAVAGAPAGCDLPVSLLAAIGEVESGSLVGRTLDRHHRTSILGPVLNGHGFAAVPDTDNGRLDGNRTWDRAVGPMQFLPSTWAVFGVDADHDGVADPQDIEDASAATARYLCYGGRDLARPDQLRSAILSYNHSVAYEQLVLTYQQRYAGLGLDDGLKVTGLPTNVALAAAPLLGTGGASGTLGDLSGAPSRHPLAARSAHHRQAGGTASARPSPSATGTPGGSPSGKPSGSPSGKPSGKPSGSPSSSSTSTPTATATPTPTATTTPTATATATATPTSTATTTPTPTTPTPTATATGCPSETPTTTPTGTPDPTPSPSPSPTCSAPDLASATPSDQ